MTLIMKNSFSLLGSLITMSICTLNLDVHAGINKKDFKSKTVSELIDILDNDELLEQKVLEKVDKKLMCKIQLASFPREVKALKENLESSLKYIGNDQALMKETIRQSEKLTIASLKTIDTYCN